MANRKSAANSGKFGAAEFERAFLAADYAHCREIVAAAHPSDVTALALSRVDFEKGIPWT